MGRKVMPGPKAVKVHRALRGPQVRKDRREQQVLKVLPVHKAHKEQ
jgi:hypothetical protein